MSEKLQALDLLVKRLSSLPGFGRRSARRAALHLLLHKDDSLTPLIGALEHARDVIMECTICGNMDDCSPCNICKDEKRKHDQLCVAEGVSDVWAIERTHSYKGLYHVLGGVLSPLEGVGPEDLKIKDLLERVENGFFDEIILALSATVDGQTTGHYLVDELEKLGKDVKITRLAHGVPVGGELDYLDEGTISTALKSRAQF